jgi:peptide chain release factor 2
LAEIRENLPVLAARVEALETLHGLAQARVDQEAVLAEMADVNFWDDAAAAQRKLDLYQQASSTVDVLGSLRQALDTLAAACARANPSVAAMARAYKYLLRELPRLEFTSWLSGPHDTCGAYLQISVRSKLAAGRHWAATLARMYLGWARQRSLSAEVLGEDLSPDGHGTTLVIAISGFGVLGLLRGETGSHRLVQTVKVSGRDNVQRLLARVLVRPELGDDVLPVPPPDLETKVSAINRGGLLLSRLTAQVLVRQAASDRRVSLAGALPPDDLAAEAVRLFCTDLYLAAEQPADQASPTDLVRTYVQNGKDKGVHDHQTGQRVVRVRQVLEGDLQPFLDEALRRRAHQGQASP